MRKQTVGAAEFKARCLELIDQVADAHIAETALVSRVPVVVTDNLRHFVGLRRHGVAVMSAAQFAETLAPTRS